MDDLPAVTVARATPDDWQVWRDLRLRALATDPDAFGSALEREHDREPAAWREMLVNPCLLARLDEVPVGLAGLTDRGSGTVDVVAMWVAPEARGHGVGARLLDVLVEMAAALGMQVQLWVADGNAARRLYERAGFVPTAERAPIRPGATVMKTRMRLP